MEVLGFQMMFLSLINFKDGFISFPKNAIITINNSTKILENFFQFLNHVSK